MNQIVLAIMCMYLVLTPPLYVILRDLINHLYNVTHKH